jgi:3-carboxy-cis,cis-muconate cycloisomerase
MRVPMTGPDSFVSLRSVFASPAIAACFDDAALIASMLAFERALARAEGACGVIPEAAAKRIDIALEDAPIDVPALVIEARRAGTLAIPFVKRITAHVAKTDEAASRFVHWGGTSQDVVDTALVLCATRATARLLERWQALGDALAALCDSHRDTPTLARTLLQPATPVPFGFRVATWIDAMTRTRGSLRRAVNDAGVIQFGGASGVLASLGSRGNEVAERLASELGLRVPSTPWHGIRDRVARLGAELAIGCEITAKIGFDVALLMQPGIDEAFEPEAPGRGGSSALPHKRNPVGAMYAREAGLRAPGLLASLIAGTGGELERGLGHWQTQFWTLGELFVAAGSGVDAMLEVIEGLRTDTGAMLRNLAATRGFVYAEALSMAIAGTLGKAAAHARVEALCRHAQSSGQTLEQALRADAELGALVPPDTARDVFDPASQFGASAAMIDQALHAWRSKES